MSDDALHRRANAGQRYHQAVRRADEARERRDGLARKIIDALREGKTITPTDPLAVQAIEAADAMKRAAADVAARREELNRT